MIEHEFDVHEYRPPISWNHKERWHDLAWHNGALYAGMCEFSRITKDAKYVEWLKGIGERNDWQLHQLPYHADHQVVGQCFLNLYRIFNDPKMMAPTKERSDWILENPQNTSLNWTKENI